MEVYQNQSDSDDQGNWHEAKKLLRFYQQMMLTIHGLAFNFNFSLDFDKAGQNGRKNGNDNESTVFLAKTMTDVQFLNENGTILPKAALADKIKSVVATYYDHLKVGYTPGDPAAQEPARFQVLNMTLDYKESDRNEAEQAVMERANAAFILIHSAKAAGWTSVNFGTADPVERYLLKCACDLLKMDCSSEKISTSLPTTKSFTKAGETQELADVAFKNVSNNILRPALIPKEKVQEEPKQSTAEAFDSLDFAA